MFPMESFMERQWEPGPWKGVFVSFPSRVNKKNQQLHFCKLLISRAENESLTYAFLMYCSSMTSL